MSQQSQALVESLLDHATTELDRAGIVDGDTDNYPGLRGAILDVIDAFSDQGHSGGSMDITIDIVNRLLRMQTLTPLTGEDDEWMDRSKESGGEPMWQNMRDPAIFKDDKRAWDLDAPDVDITFPYSRS